MHYYRLIDNIDYQGRWYLGDVRESENNWEFSDTNFDLRKYNYLSLEVYKAGEPLDFTMSEIYGVPVVSEKFRDCLGENEGLAYIPVQIESQTFYILHISISVDCVNEEVSKFQKFLFNDPIRPDKAGQFKGFEKLELNRRVINKEIFRLENFNVAIVLSQSLAKRIQQLSGVKLIRVTSEIPE